MFGNLIESNSHAKELKRKGSFMLSASVFYAALLLAAGVGSIYAYDTHLDNQSLELITLVTPPETEPPQPVVQPMPPAAPPATVNQTNATPITQPQRDAPEIDPTMLPDTISTTVNNSRPTPPSLPPGTGNEINLSNNISFGVPRGNNIGDGANGANRSDGERANTQPPPPMPPRRAAPPRLVSRGVINGLATYKPQPAYPLAARLARVQGQVVVQIVVDEHGRVMSAQATSGHALLRQAAVAAARRARFTPTLLSDQPVRVSGAITYNFILE